MKNKLDVVEFFNYLKEFHIFLLYETHLLNIDESRYTNIFKNYELKWKPAVKRNIFGRASGGELLAYRKNLEGVKPEFEEKCNSYVV